MENIKKLLIANRGEIAVRIIRSAKALGIHTTAIYTEADAASQHAVTADDAVLLPGGNSTAYTDGAAIVEIAKSRNIDAVIPGYGFLSENTDFCREITEAGIVFVGPSPEAIESFGLKHKARDLAIEAGVPIVPGTAGLVESEEEAVSEANRLGYPIMLKATGGGGGMGLITCKNESEVKSGLEMVRSRGETLFKNSGVFIERFFPESRHIEVQVFGNGLGNAIHFGERECSIQRRHQKVIEECPSPFVTKHPELRAKLGDAAVRLAESVKYASAGTIEYLVDDATGDFFFLEMNTRLQVEHGITELCYGVDLVEMMLRQADAQRGGAGGLEKSYLAKFAGRQPNGSAIEARVYAENPSRNYAPSPGLLQEVKWKEGDGVRVDTWVRTGTKITTFYDPLIAKLMFHAPTRPDAISGMVDALTESRLCGPPTNIGFLKAILQTPEFQSGFTLTSFLNTFKYAPAAIDVIKGGAYTLVQDYPGRPSIGKGIPHSGPMDSLAFQLANILAGNPAGLEGLEITLDGPKLLFLGAAIVSLCGAPFEVSLDGKPFPMWTRVKIEAGQELSIGKTTGEGCRAYLAVYGGFPTVAKYFNSKSTSPMVSIGGYQGRQLAPGDFLSIAETLPASFKDLTLPETLRPEYSSHYDIAAMVGPYDEGFLLPEDIEMIYETNWKISHNASRSGIRLIGPVPKWARASGGEGGAHPSNLIEYGYPLGTLNWTGDDPCLFPIDCPDFGGFVSSTTVVKAEWWRLGQLKPGNTLRYHRVSLEDALTLREREAKFIKEVASFAAGEIQDSKISPLKYDLPPSENWGSAVVHHIEPQGHRPQVNYRQGAEDFLVIEYGIDSFDLNHLCRATALNKALEESTGEVSYKTGLVKTVGCCNSLMIHYDGSILPRQKLLAYLISLESQLGDLSAAKVPSRKFKLPVAFDNERQAAAIRRYMETQRPFAPYLPDNMKFVAETNGLTRGDLERIYLTGSFMAVAVGFLCANTVCLPVDPRHRLSAPKQNPSRVFTPEGSISWGGSCVSLYPVDSPGGYQMTGLTIPCFDLLGFKKGYSPSRPWLYDDFDQLTFYLVSEDELEAQLAKFKMGTYEYEVEDVLFDMAEHNALLESTKEEVKALKRRQHEAQAAMAVREKESMELWKTQQARMEIPVDNLQELLADPEIEAVQAPMNANVWKVLVKEGDVLEKDQVVVILEAMKLEINVKVDDELVGSKVELVMVQPGDSVVAGDNVVLARKGYAKF